MFGEARVICWGGGEEGAFSHFKDDKNSVKTISINLTKQYTYTMYLHMATNKNAKF
jgi:hypothetical protein